MTKFSPETEKRIAELIELRNEKIFEINGLWARLFRLRLDEDQKDEKVDYRQFDYQIKDWFQTTSGRESLSFESIEKVKRSLEKAIKLEEENKNGTGISGIGVGEIAQTRVV